MATHLRDNLSVVAEMIVVNIRLVLFHSARDAGPVYHLNSGGATALFYLLAALRNFGYNAGVLTITSGSLKLQTQYHATEIAQILQPEDVEYQCLSHYHPISRSFSFF